MKNRIKIIFVAFAILAVALVVFISLAILDAEKKIAEEKAAREGDSGSVIPFGSPSQQRLDQNKREGWQQLSCLHDVRDMVMHEGFIFLATHGGLLKFSLSLEFLERYTQLNGLPDLELESLLSDDGILYVGSKKGLSLIREEIISSYVIDSVDFAGVTSLAKYEGRIFIGTRGAGVLALGEMGFDSPLAKLPGADFKDITDIYPWQSGLAIGTRDAGLYVMQGASFVHLDKDKGLESQHVTSLGGDSELLVATTEGVAKVDSELRMKPWLKEIMTSAVLQKEEAVYLGTLDGRCHHYFRGSSRRSWPFGNKYDPAVTRALVEVAGEVWALTSRGAFSLTGEVPGKLNIPARESLEGSYIASMTNSNDGRLWLGYFDQGIEVLDNSLNKDKYFDQPDLKTVKHLVFNSATNAVYVGTSSGLTKIDSRYSASGFSRKDGLINNEVNHVQILDSGELCLGTGGGLSFLTENGIKSIYAFHGLINNKVFAQLETEAESLGASGRKLLVGTLGGISLVRDKEVISNITPENSALPIHWVTALAEVDGSIFIGTYGAGVSVINPDGSWAEMPEFIRRLEINPNAFFDSEEYFFAGTLDMGILLLDKKESRWQLIREDLGSLNITAFSEDESRYYIGSDAGVTIVNKGSLVK